MQPLMLVDYTGIPGINIYPGKIFRNYDIKKKNSFLDFERGKAVVVVVVVFTLNSYFYPATSAVPPASFLILHPREIQILWSQ